MEECLPTFSLYNIGLSLVFCTLFCLSFIGNTIVIITILHRRHKAHRSITNLYLLNLAVADLLRSVVCMPTTLVSELTRCWVFGPLMCKLVAYLQPVGVCASAYTLAVIAIERYYAICRPLHSRKWHTKKRAISLLCLVWLWSLACNVGSLVVFDAQPFKNYWMCSTIKGQVVDFFYQLYVTLVLLFIPLGLMVALYGSVIYTLSLAINSDQDYDGVSMLDQGVECAAERNSLAEWIFTAVKATKKKKTMDTLSLPGPPSSLPTPRNGCTRSSFGRRSIFGILTPRCSLDSNIMVLRSTNQDKILVAKRRVTRMLITIVVLFALCWTPSYIFWLVVRFCDLFGYNAWNNDLNTILTILTYISSCTNPITYCFMNKSFRHSLLNYCSRTANRRCASPMTFRSQSMGRADETPRGITLPLIRVDLVDLNANPVLQTSPLLLVNNVKPINNNEEQEGQL